MGTGAGAGTGKGRNLNPSYVSADAILIDVKVSACGQGFGRREKAQLLYNMLACES